MKLLPIASALSVAILSTSTLAATSPVEFYGYMRGGVGLSNEGGSNSKWEVNKVGRLGNEDDLYGEFGLKKKCMQKTMCHSLLTRCLNTGKGKTKTPKIAVLS